MGSARYVLPAMVASWLAATGSVARAQSIEPRAYSNSPVGVNFLVAGYAYTHGGASFDTALPLSDPDLTTSSHLACKTEVDDGRMLLWRNTALSLIDMRTPRELLRYGDVEEIPASYKVQARADGERFSADTEALDPFTDSLHYVIENHVPYTSTFVPRGADAPADPALDAFLASLSTLGVCAPIGADASGAIVVRCRQHMTRYVRVVRADGAYRVEGPPRPLATHYNGSVRTDSKLGGYVVVEQAHDDPISGWLWQRHLWALLDPTSLEPQLWILFGWDYALVTDGVRYQRLGNVEHAAAFLRCKYPDGTLKPYATCANDASLF